MPNSIKYSTSQQSLALRKGNFWIGTGDVGKGPTDVTDYWNGITPPSNGYTIYLNKTTGGPSIYIVNNDSELITLTNQIANTSFTTVEECLIYYSTQNDKMAFNQDYPPIVTDGLVLNLDAGFVGSYPTSGTTWYDLGPEGNNGTLVNGPTFDSQNGGSIVFDGVDDILTTSYSLSSNTFSLCFWIKIPTALTEFKRLFQVSGNSLLVFIESSLAVTFRTQSDFSFFAPGSLTLNQWGYVSCVYDNSFRYLYINGVLRGQIATLSINQNLSNLTINNAGRPLNCFISQTSLYSRAL